MDYSKQKTEIEKQMEELAESIEKFCVIKNEIYTSSYKSELLELHNKLEELLNY